MNHYSLINQQVRTHLKALKTAAARAKTTTIAATAIEQVCHLISSLSLSLSLYYHRHRHCCQLFYFVYSTFEYVDLCELFLTLIKVTV